MNIYQIKFRNIRVEVSIGIHDFERRGPQPMSVSLFLAVRNGGELRDDISTVVDYDAFREIVHEEAAQPHWELQEALCLKIADRCLAIEGIVAVMVKTEKTSVYPDTEAVGCKIAKIREDVRDELPRWIFDD